MDTIYRLFGKGFEEFNDKDIIRYAEIRSLWNMEDWLLQRANNNKERAKQFAEYLTSIDWEQVVLRQEEDRIREEKREKQEIQKFFSNGGGYCEWCHELMDYLYSWTHEYTSEYAKPGSKYCRKDFRDFELRARIPSDEWLEVCDWANCQILLPYKSLIRDERLEKKINDAHMHYYCQDHYPLILKRYSIQCSICGKETIDYINQSVCSDCYVKPSSNYNVSNHLNRARILGLPATLTITQWEHAVKYFNNRCAYCGNAPYTVLEHYHPLSKGQGGTTQENCVPACGSCNVRKGDALPIYFERIFPKENIERIKEYFASIQAL